MARILVTGAGGQIGSYVVDELLDGGHDVVAVGPDSRRVPSLAESLDASNVGALLGSIGTLDAVIHLAALSSVAASWEAPANTLLANTVVTAALLDETRRRFPRASFVHASSAEIFGKTEASFQTESTPLAPVSPYGVSKAASHTLVQIARDSQGFAASNAVFYLGESERRPPHFVFRKITRGLAKIALGLESKLILGNMEVVRDFSHASDLGRAAVHIALGAPAGDYICASGTGYSLGALVSEAAKALGIEHESRIEIDRSLFRPTDIPSLIGKSDKLRSAGFASRIDFHELVRRIVAFDLAELRKEKEKSGS